MKWMIGIVGISPTSYYSMDDWDEMDYTYLYIMIIGIHS